MESLFYCLKDITKGQNYFVIKPIFVRLNSCNRNDLLLAATFLIASGYIAFKQNLCDYEARGDVFF